MKDINQSTYSLEELTSFIRNKIRKGDLLDCEDPILQKFIDEPHSPVPHNLLGIVLEKKGEHSLAMKHFRAALALDPAYLPARQNLEVYGTFLHQSTCAYDESDCQGEKKRRYEMVIDEKGIGHMKIKL